MTDPRTTVELPSFEDWAETRVAQLMRFAFLVLGSQHAAEDAVQSALAKACERWTRVARTRDPEAYVRRMIVNEHISGWRRTRRESPVELVRDPVHDVGSADPAARLADEDAVWAVCRGLPRRQRAAVVLRFYEDLDYAEIAAVLDCTETTVRSHVHRALAALRVALTDPEGER